MAVLTGAAGSALAGNGHGPVTFEGTCELSGLLSQSPPITNVPQPGDATARARGTCSGTLTGARGVARELESAPSSYVASASGSMSCGGRSATGAAHVSQDEDPADIAAKCGGEGLRSAHIDIDLATTPAISG